MTEEELNRIERRWNGNENPGFLIVSSEDVSALIAEVRRLQKCRWCGDEIGAICRNCYEYG